jgi:hypothetical protein
VLWAFFATKVKVVTLVFFSVISPPVGAPQIWVILARSPTDLELFLFSPIDLVCRLRKPHRFGLWNVQPYRCGTYFREAPPIWGLQICIWEAPQIWVEIRIGNRFGSLFLEAPQIWIYPFLKKCLARAQKI